MRFLTPAVSALTLAIGLCLVPAPVAAEDTLYHRLGEMKAVHAVVDEFVGRIVADEHLHHWFEHVSTDEHEAAAYKEHLANFICQAAGGPCEYHGKDMMAAHADLHVTAEAWDAVVLHLHETLDHLSVHEHEKTELLTLVGGLKSAVVGH